MRRSRLTAAVVLVVALYYGWSIFLSGDVFRRHSSNAGNREAIVQLYSGVPVGADREMLCSNIGRTGPSTSDLTWGIPTVGSSPCPPSSGGRTGH